jgi:hypothetical protein
MFDRNRISPDDAMYEHVDDINSAISKVRARLVDEIDTSSQNWSFWVLTSARRYLQAHIRRALMFLDGGKHALDGGYGLVALTCARSLDESAACIYDFCTKFCDMLEAKNIDGAAQMVHERSLHVRFDEFRPSLEGHNFKPPSIMKYIDAMEDEVPGARRSYEQLSETVHPNAFGALLYFERQEGDVARYCNNAPELDAYGLLVASASLFSLIHQSLLRFDSAMLLLMADDLQERIDDYERRKAAGLTAD